MFYNSKLFLLIFSLLIPVLANAQDSLKTTLLDEIVVTENRYETTYKEIASSVTVIGQAELEQSKGAMVLDILRIVPALDVVQLGGAGGQTSIFIRGASSSQALVLIDGVEANDPISPGRAFDFSGLSAQNIERIEVLRGPQSTLYGSDAISGVINIITKKGAGATRSSFSSSAGRYGFLNSIFETGGQTGLLNYSLNLSRSQTDGISSSVDKNAELESDGNENTTVSLRTGIDLDNTKISLTARYYDNKADLDNGGGPYMDDPNNLLETKHGFIRAEAVQNLFEGRMTQKYGLSFTLLKRENSNETDTFNPNVVFNEVQEGKIVKFDLQNDLELSQWNKITFGMEIEKETGSSVRTGQWANEFAEKSSGTAGFYMQEKITAGNSFFVTGGVRLENHEQFGTHMTYRLTPAYWLLNSMTKLKASVGTGFKSPSLYQLFSAFGNEQLQPEENLGWEIGLEQYLFDASLVFGASWFNADYENLIDYDGATFSYNNIGKAITKGVELSLSYNHGSGLTLRGNYSYTDAQNSETNEVLIRRAKHKYALSAFYPVSDRLSISSSLKYSGARFDNDFSTWPATRIELQSFTLADITADYTLMNSLTVFAKAENLFNADYMTAFGYGSLGRAPYAGFKIAF